MKLIFGGSGTRYGIAAMAVLVAVVSATSSALLFSREGEHASATSAYPFVAIGDAPGQQSSSHDGHDGTPDFQSIKGVGFVSAERALGGAVDLMPFAVRLPAYLPGGLQPWLVSGSVSDDGGAGVLETFYSGPFEGAPPQGVRIFQSNARGKDDLRSEIGPIVEERLYTWGGMEWSFAKMAWRDFDTLEVRALADDGTFLFVEIRVIGMDETEALLELEKVATGLVSVEA